MSKILHIDISIKKTKKMKISVMILITLFIMTINAYSQSNQDIDVLKKIVGDEDLSVKRAILSTIRFLNKRHSMLVEDFIVKHKLVEVID